MADERRTIGGLKVVRLLGRGGMSEVYEVEDPRLGSRHALKLFAYPKDDPDVVARFESEGRLLARLSHPRIVKVTDIGTDAESGKPYFVMDLVLDPSDETKTLADVPEGEADEDKVGMWYDDIREGLAYIHSKGIVHRDLKLQNIMIGADGHAVITDFGISKIIDPGKSDVAAADPVQTILRLKDGKSLVMGSLGYMAPELEMGLPATPRSDWFALGVIVYKLLTGIWCDAKTDVSGTLDTYDPVWKRIIPKLLHSNPEGRECLSFADEKSRDREAQELEWENRWIAAKSRGHLARHVARYAAAVSVLLLGALCWQFRELSVQREVMKLKYEAAGLRPAVPSFDELFKVPSEATDEDQMDANNNVIMPSRESFERARIDALVLTHQTMADLSAGNINSEKAVSSLRELSDKIDNAAQFDVGGVEYSTDGISDEALKWLLQRAMERLRSTAEK